MNPLGTLVVSGTLSLREDYIMCLYAHISTWSGKYKAFVLVITLNYSIDDVVL